MSQRSCTGSRDPRRRSSSFDPLRLDYIRSTHISSTRRLHPVPPLTSFLHHPAPPRVHSQPIQTVSYSLLLHTLASCRPRHRQRSPGAHLPTSSSLPALACSLPASYCPLVHVSGDSPCIAHTDMPKAKKQKQTRSQASPLRRRPNTRSQTQADAAIASRVPSIEAIPATEPSAAEPASCTPTPTTAAPSTAPDPPAVQETEPAWASRVWDGTTVS